MAVAFIHDHNHSFSTIQKVVLVKLALKEIRHLRAHSQGLNAESSNVADIIQALCGLQSQELTSASLAIRARSKNLTIDHVKTAREIEHSIILTWSMRGTMHLVHVEDLAWLTELFGEQCIRETKRRYAELGLDEAILQKAAKLLPEILSRQGALSRAELAQALAPHKLPVEGQAMPHLMRYAALKGILCFGAEEDGDLTYVLLDDWLKSAKAFTPKNPEAELARRYLRAYAPATVQDFAVWSGLSMGQAKEGFNAIASELLEIESEIGNLFMLKKQKQVFAESLRLLPRYDNYLLGYQHRNFMVDKAFAKQIHPGGGLIRACLIIDGEAKASWSTEQKRGKIVISVAAFEPLAEEYLPALEIEALDLGRFLKQESLLNIEKS